MRRLFYRLRNLPNPLKLLLNALHQMPDPSPRNDRIMMLLGHYSILAIIVFGAWSVADDLTGKSVGWLGDAGNFLDAGFMACLYSEMRWHGRRLCERCARESPDDPETQVRRWRAALRWAHADRPRSAFMISLLGVIALESVWGMDGYRNDVDVAVVTAIVAVWVVARRHSRLQPWCPWCNWGKGGDKEVSPEVPDPALSK